MPMSVSVRYNLDVDHDELETILSGLERKLRGRNATASANALASKLRNERIATTSSSSATPTPIATTPAMRRGRGRPPRTTSEVVMEVAAAMREEDAPATNGFGISRPGTD